MLKYWVSKRGAPHAAEALECLGGNGYVEESGMPRLYREAPLNSIWEGSGNVKCLDVLRAMAQARESVEAFLAEVGEAAGAEPRLDALALQLRDELRTSTRSRRAPAASSSGWRSSLQGRCWSARRRRSPTRSSPPGWAATGAGRSGRCRAGPTSGDHRARRRVSEGISPSERIRRHLQTHIVAYLALFVALGGTAVALPGKNTVKLNDIARGAVKGKSLAADAVKKRKIRNAAVVNAKLADRAVTAPKLADGLVSAQKLAAGAVGTGALADSSP